jgi:hypothetical protein
MSQTERKEALTRPFRAAPNDVLISAGVTTPAAFAERNVLGRASSPGHSPSPLARNDVEARRGRREGVAATNPAGSAVAGIDGSDFGLALCPAPCKSDTHISPVAKPCRHGHPAFLTRAGPLIYARPWAGTWARSWIRGWSWSSLHLRGTTLHAALGKNLRPCQPHNSSHEHRESQQPHPPLHLSKRSS